MAKKSKFAKVVVALGAIGVASKIAYDKYKNVKDDFVKEETASAEDDVKKYNAIFEKKVVEVEDEEFMGCEVKAVGSKAVIDLGLAVFERDVYINFSSNASTVTIILPEGVNVTCDVEKKLSGVRNLVENSDEDGVHTVYIIGKAVCSNVEIIPVNFYIDDDDFEDIDDSEDDLKMNLLMRQKIKKMFLHRIQMRKLRLRMIQMGKLSRKMNLRLKKLKRIKGITGFYGKIQR